MKTKCKKIKTKYQKTEKKKYKIKYQKTKKKKKIVLKIWFNE